MRISDWSSDVCSSDLSGGVVSTTDPLDRCQYSDAEISAIVEECRRHGVYVAAHCHPAEAIRRCAELGVRSIEHGTLIDEATANVVAAQGAYVVPTMATIFALKDLGPSLGLADESRSEEHTSELQSLMRISYAVFCLKKKQHN